MGFFGESYRRVLDSCAVLEGLRDLIKRFDDIQSGISCLCISA